MDIGRYCEDSGTIEEFEAAPMPCGANKRRQPPCYGCAQYLFEHFFLASDNMLTNQRDAVDSNAVAQPVTVAYALLKVPTVPPTLKFECFCY